MVQVPDLESFNKLVARVDRVETENEFLKSLLLSQRWLNRRQAMNALGCKDEKLRLLTISGRLDHRYEGKTPMYDAYSIRTYLMAKKIDASLVDKRILSAHFVS